VQALKAAPSRLHWKEVTVVSLSVNENDALVEVEGFDGAKVIVGAGGGGGTIVHE
jgi:hypothetical protein